MSQEVLEQVIARMATDPAFAASVQSDAAAALAGLDMTDEERQTVASLTADAGGGPTRLAPRSSKSALFFGSALHDATAPIAHHGAGDAGHAPPDAHIAPPTPAQQAVAWVTSMDPGAADEEQALAAGAQAVESGGSTSGEVEEAAAEEIAEIVAEGTDPA